MSKELEIEYKTLLNKEKFQQLIEEFQPTHYLIQENYYFDTNDNILKQENCGLRIRKSQDFIEMTLKQKQKEHQTLETTANLTKLDWQNFIINKTIPNTNSINNILKQMDIPITDLTLIAKLTTKRYTINLDKNITIMLDHSTYYNQEDFELEMEFPKIENSQQIFLNFLKTHNILFNKSDTKIARAIKASKK